MENTSSTGTSNPNINANDGDNNNSSSKKVEGGTTDPNNNNNNSSNNNNLMTSRFSDVGLDLLVVEEGVVMSDNCVVPQPSHPYCPPTLPIKMDVSAVNNLSPRDVVPFAIVASEDDVVDIDNVDVHSGGVGDDDNDEKDKEVEEELMKEHALRRNRSGTNNTNNNNNNTNDRGGSTKNFLRRFISNTSLSTWTLVGSSSDPPRGGGGSGGGLGGLRRRQRGASAIDTRIIQSAIRKLGVDDDDDDDDGDIYSNNDDDHKISTIDGKGKSSDASSTAKSVLESAEAAAAAAAAAEVNNPPHLLTSSRRSASSRKLGSRSCHSNNYNAHRKKVTEWYSDRIQRALEYTGTQSYGIVGIEVWEHQQQSRSKSYRLRMPGGGRWISPYLQIGTTNLEQRDAINTLLDDPRFVPPQTQTVGVGLEGELWSRAKLGYVSGSADDDFVHGDDMSSISFKVNGDDDDGGGADDGGGVRDDLSISRRSWARSSIISILDRSKGKSTRNNSSNALDRNSSPDLGALEAGQKDTTSNRQELFGRQPSRLKGNQGMREKDRHKKHPSSRHHHDHIVAAALAEKLQPHYHHHGQTLVWRDINQIFIDPDTPKCPRLEQQMIAGFGQAAAIPFKENGHEGIVIFLARKQSSATKKGRFHSVDYLNSFENQEFLFRQAKMIGSLISNAYAGRALEGAKQRMIRAAWHRFAHNLVEHKRSLHEEQRTSSPSHPEKGYIRRRTSSFNTFRQLKHVPRQVTRQVWNDTKSYMMKWKGGGGGSNVIPPPLDAPQSAWTWLGVFCGLLILSAYNEKIIAASDGRYELLIGPFGALMTLIYGLHSAPASQPRNVVLGQVVSGAVSLSFTYIPENILPVWVRRAVGPAFSIAAMVKLGVTHPPAGAHSVIYAGGKSNWTEYFLVVLGASISVLPAVIINNLSVRRQYPVYWGYIFESIKLRWRLYGSRNKK